MNKLIKRVTAIGVAGLLAASAAVTAFADEVTTDKI